VPPLEPLSDSEMQILRLVLDGKTTRQIASTIKRSTRTVEAHRHSIMRKLSVKNVPQLVRRATEIGLNRTFPRWDNADTSYDLASR
jgi:two-component system response regulator NreC